MSAAGFYTRGSLTRAIRLAAVASIVGLLAVSSATAARTSTSTDIDRELGVAVVAEINGLRSAHGLRRLRVSGGLTRAARQHAVSMAGLGYFSHSSSDGRAPVRRITAYYPVKGSVHWAVGEVLLWADSDISASAIVAAWLASSAHARELLKPGWRELGVGAVKAANAPGVFGGRDVTIVVVDFGAR